MIGNRNRHERRKAVAQAKTVLRDIMDLESRVASYDAEINTKSAHLASLEEGNKWGRVYLEARLRVLNSRRAGAAKSIEALRARLPVPPDMGKSERAI